MSKLLSSPEIVEGSGARKHCVTPSTSCSGEQEVGGEPSGHNFCLVFKTSTIKRPLTLGTPLPSPAFSSLLSSTQRKPPGQGGCHLNRMMLSIVTIQCGMPWPSRTAMGLRQPAPSPSAPRRRLFLLVGCSCICARLAPPPSQMASLTLPPCLPEGAGLLKLLML